MSATRGVPVTVTASSNSTVTTITSPRMKVPPSSLPSEIPPTVTPVTVGARASVPSPSTTISPSVIAWTPSPSAASLFPRSRIVPPFRESAFAPAPIPLESSSPEATV